MKSSKDIKFSLLKIFCNLLALDYFPKSISFAEYKMKKYY